MDDHQIYKSTGSSSTLGEVSHTSHTVSLPSFMQDENASIIDNIRVPGTSGKPDRVYKVAKGLIPDELQAGLVKDFSEYERHEILHRIDVYQAECDHVRPKALWLFGPPAVGKTTASNERAWEMFGWPDNAVTVDGADFRIVHKGFQMVAQHGMRNNLLHADAWAMLKGSGFMDKLKEEVVELAIRNRQHLKIPETAVSAGRVDRMLDHLVAAGYELHAVCLWAPKSETEARGRARGVKEGKAFTTKEYEKSSGNALHYGKRWHEKIEQGDHHYKSVMFYDNTVFPSRPVHMSEFQHLTEMTDAIANAHADEAKARRCANVQADIAASEAFAKGKSRRSVVRSAESAWRKALLQTKRLVQSSSPGDWSSSHPQNVSELLYAERRRGQAEGLCAGIIIGIAAIVVNCYVVPVIRRR